MRNHLLFAALLISGWSSDGICQTSSESALGDPAPAAVQDPSLGNSRYFPPAQGTAGVAAIGPASRPSHTAKCSATNPCALPTPARDRVVVVQDKS